MTLLKGLRAARQATVERGHMAVVVTVPTADAVVALIEAAQAVKKRKDEVSAYQNDATIQALLEALDAFTEYEPDVIRALDALVAELEAAKKERLAVEGELQEFYKIHEETSKRAEAAYPYVKDAWNELPDNVVRKLVEDDLELIAPLLRTGAAEETS